MSARPAAAVAALLVLALCGCRQASREAGMAGQRALAESAARKALAERAAQSAKAPAAEAAADSGSGALVKAGERIVHVGGHHAFTKGVDEAKEKWRDRVLANGQQPSAETEPGD